MKTRTAALALTLTATGFMSGCGAPEPQSRSTPPSAPATTVAAQPVPQAAQDLPPDQGVQSLSLDAYRVEWGAFEVPAVVKPGSKTPVQVSFKNTSPAAWPSGGGTAGMSYTVRLGHRWLTPVPGQDPKEVVGWGNHRVELPKPLKPGETVVLLDTLTAPSAKGPYLVEFQLVHEGVAWFADRGGAAKIVPTKVE